MTPPLAGKLHEFVTQQKWESATALLQGLSASDASDLIMAVRFEEQQELFRRLPIPLVASIVNHLPYFHAYVLLHARSLHEMAAIVEAMSQAERDDFLDALPEEAWNSLMDELAEAGSQPRRMPLKFPKRNMSRVSPRELLLTRSRLLRLANLKKFYAERRKRNPSDRARGFIG